MLLSLLRVMYGFQELAEQRKYKERRSSSIVTNGGSIRRRRKSVTLSDIGVNNTLPITSDRNSLDNIDAKVRRYSIESQRPSNVNEVYQTSRSNKIVEALEEDIVVWKSKYQNIHSVLVEMSQDVISQKLRIKKLENDNYLLRESLQERYATCAKHEKRSAAFYCHAQSCDLYLQVTEREASSYRNALHGWSLQCQAASRLILMANSKICNPETSALLNEGIGLINNETSASIISEQELKSSVEKQAILVEMSRAYAEANNQHSEGSQIMTIILSKYNEAKSIANTTQSDVECLPLSDMRKETLKSLLRSVDAASNSESIMRMFLLQQRIAPGDDSERRVASIVARSAIKLLRFKLDREQKISAAENDRIRRSYHRRRKLISKLQTFEQLMMTGNDTFFLQRLATKSLAINKNHRRAVSLISTLTKERLISSSQQADIDRSLKSSCFENMISFIVNGISSTLSQTCRIITTSLSLSLSQLHCDISVVCIEIGVALRNLINILGEKTHHFAMTFSSEEERAKENWLRSSSEMQCDVSVQTDTSVVVSESVRIDVRNCWMQCTDIISTLKISNEEQLSLQHANKNLCDLVSVLLRNLHEISIIELEKAKHCDLVTYSNNLSNLIILITASECNDNNVSTLSESELVHSTTNLLSKLSEVLTSMSSSEHEKREIRNTKVKFLGHLDGQKNIRSLLNKSRAKSLDMAVVREAENDPQDYIGSYSCTSASSLRHLNSRSSSSPSSLLQHTGLKQR